MSSYILFLILGLGSGAVYALLALGLVLKYRSTGIVDFGHGAVAMFTAYVFLGLRNSGTLALPWVVIPHQVTLTGSPIATAPAMAIALAYAVLLGLVMHLLIYRPLRRATPLTRICASVGTMLYLGAIAVLNFGTTPATTSPILPAQPLTFAGVTIPVDRLWLTVIALLLTAGLAALYRFTRFGLATRAAAENDQGAAVIGLSAERIARGNWVLATLLAGLAGILIAPISTVNPTSYTLFIVPALAVALLARFNSFAVAGIAGLVLGMLQSEVTKIITVVTWLPQNGLPEALPFIVVVVTITFASRAIAARGEVVEQLNPSLGRPRRPWVSAAATFAIGVLALLALQGSLRSALIASIITACIGLSLVVLTGFVGQVSLAQMSFAGASAFTLTHITGNLGIGFPFSLLLASFAAVPLGLLVGLPALRLRGINLAVVTLAAAYVIDALVFNWIGFTGGEAGRAMAPPTLFGLNLGIANGKTYPTVIFGVLVLGIVCLVGLLVARLRNAPAGRMMIAVRSNERAAAASGIDVARTKLFAFGLSAWIAGLGGGLFAYDVGTVSPQSFSTFTSLGLLAIVYIAGVGRIAGAAVAGVMLSSTGLLVTFLDTKFGIGKYQLIVAGLALTITAIKQPNGIAATPPPPLVALGKRLSKHWTSMIDRCGAEPAASAVPKTSEAAKSRGPA